MKAVTNPSPKKILVIHWGALGDMIVATPALRAIREANPHARITLVSVPLMRQIAPDGVFADEILAFDERRLKNLLFDARLGYRLARRQFELAVNFRYTSERSALLAYLSLARRRAGAGPPRWMWCYTQKIPYPKSHYNELYRYCDIARALGAEPRELQPYVHCTAEHEAFAEEWLHKKKLSAPLVCLHPGASHPYRAWLPERYAELGRRIAHRFGAAILVTHGARERETAELVVSLIGGGAALAPGTPTIGHLAAIFKRCALVACNNSGAMHVAVAAGAPVAALHGATELEDWQPLGARHISIKSPVVANAWNPAEERNAMDALSIEDVWAAVEKRLEEVFAKTNPPLPR